MVPKKCLPPDRVKQKQQNIITFPEPSMSMNYTGHVNNSNHTMTMQSAKSRDPEIPAPEDTVQVGPRHPGTQGRCTGCWGRNRISGLTQPGAL